MNGPDVQRNHKKITSCIVNSNSGFFISSDKLYSFLLLINTKSGLLGLDKSQINPGRLPTTCQGTASFGILFLLKMKFIDDKNHSIIDHYNKKKYPFLKIKINIPNCVLSSCSVTKFKSKYRDNTRCNSQRSPYT